MMKKKVKKIPKYYNGELAVGMPDMSNYKIQNKMGITPPSSSSTISYSGNENWADMTNNQKSAAVANAIGGGADLINMVTSGQKATVGKRCLSRCSIRANWCWCWCSDWCNCRNGW